MAKDESVSEEDKTNGYTREQMDDGTFKITILRSKREFILEEPGFEKRDIVYSIVRKIVQNVDSKEIQQKKVQIAKAKGISVEDLHKEMENGELDEDFAVELETMVRDKNMNLLADDRDYMMEVIGTAMDKPREEWKEIENSMKISDGKVLYDACLAFLIEIFQEMQGDRKK